MSPMSLSPMRRGFLAVSAACLVVAAPTFLHADPVHSKTGNYCVDEAEDRLHESFGPDARITKAQIVQGGGGSGALDTLWVATNMCKDYIAFSAIGRDHCTMPAYISAPRSSFEIMWGYGDCANLVEEASRAGDRHEARAPDLPRTSGPATSP